MVGLDPPSLSLSLSLTWYVKEEKRREFVCEFIENEQYNVGVRDGGGWILACWRLEILQVKNQVGHVGGECECLKWGCVCERERERGYLLISI